MRIVGIIVGIVAAVVAQSICDLLINQAYPSQITDLWNRQQVNEAFAARPAVALILAICGFLVGALVGGVVGKLIGRRPAAAWAGAVVLAAMAGLLGLNFPQPGWASIGMVVAALVGGLLANHLVETRSGETAGAAADEQAVGDS